MRTDRPDDPALVAEVVARLMRVRAGLGAKTFRNAVDRALHAIGTAVHAEAERKAGRLSRPRPARASNVVPFPGDGRRIGPGEES